MERKEQDALEKLGYLQYPCDENTWIKDANTQIIFYNGKPYGFYMGRERALTPEEKTACAEVIKEIEVEKMKGKEKL